MNIQTNTHTNTKKNSGSRNSIGPKPKFSTNYSYNKKFLATNTTVGLFIGVDQKL